MKTISALINETKATSLEQINRELIFRAALELHRFDITQIGNAISEAFTWANYSWGPKASHPYLWFQLDDIGEGKIAIRVTVYAADLPLIRGIIANLAQMGYYGSLDYEFDDDMVWIHHISKELVCRIRFSNRADCIMVKETVTRTVRKCPRENTREI